MGLSSSQTDRLEPPVPPAREAAALPGPRRYPLLGNVPQVTGDRLMYRLQRLARRHGDLFQLSIPPRRFAVVSHPEGARAALLDEFEHTKRPTALEIPAPLYGTDSMFLVDGERWSSRRRLFNRAFKPDQVARLVEIVNERTGILCGILDRAVAAGEPIDVKPHFARLAMDVNGLFMYGHDFDTQHGGGEYDRCLSDFWNHVSWRIAIPFPYHRFLPTLDVLRCRRALRKLDGLLQAALQARRAQPIPGDAHDVLTLMLRANASPEAGGAASPGCPAHEFGEKEIRDQLFTYMNAGVETTTSTLSWLVYHLCVNGQWQERLAAEAAPVCGEAPPDLAQVKGLVWADAVVSESLRLRPGVASILRGLTRDIEILGCSIPRQWEVWVNIYAMHRDPRFWSQPDAFLPERWVEDQPLRHRYQYLPFGGGPRICQGELAAMVTSKLVCARLCSRYQLRLEQGANIQPDNGFFVQVQGGLPLRVARRS
jgi:cytochrome P450